MRPNLSNPKSIMGDKHKQRDPMTDSDSSQTMNDNTKATDNDEAKPGNPPKPMWWLNARHRSIKHGSKRRQNFRRKK